MRTYDVSTYKYDIDLVQLVSRRLDQCGCAYTLDGADGTVRVGVYGDGGVSALGDALSLLICRDLQYFELAAMTDALPLELADKQAVLEETLRTCRRGEELSGVREGLTAYLRQTDRLNLEGYIGFRMRDTLGAWRLALECACSDRLLSREYTELMGVLNTFVRMQRPRMGEIAVCINADGSCTLTDDSDVRIEYVDCSEDGIVSLLVSMAPQRLIVYDLSDGNGRRLADAIARVFAGRVRVYR